MSYHLTTIGALRPPKKRAATPWSKKPYRGVALLETIFVLIVAVSALTAGVYYMSENAKQKLATSTAAHLVELSDAYNKYIQDNYADLVDEVSVYKHIDLDVLTNPIHGEQGGASYLPVDFKGTNAYAQEYVLSLRKVGTTLQGLIYSRGGEVIEPAQAMRISQLVGASGGFTLPTDPSAVKATMDGYHVSLTSFGGGGQGGKLVSAVFMNEHAMTHEDYLYRRAIEGRPELNRMNTDLNMGGWDINSAKNVNVLIDARVGNDVEVGRDIEVGRNLTVNNNTFVGGRLTVNNNLDVKGNVTGAGYAIVKGKVVGRDGVKSGKTGTLGGACSGGEIGFWAERNTTLLCRKGQWVTMDYVVGHSGKKSNHSSHSGIGAFYRSDVGGALETHTIYCTDFGLGYLHGAQGGMHFSYNQTKDIGGIHPDCRHIGWADHTYETLFAKQVDHSLWSDVTETVDVDNIEKIYTTIRN